MAQRPDAVNLEPGAAGEPLVVARADVSAASVSRGSIEKKASNRSASKPSCGGNCQRIGPSFSRSRRTPEAKKLASGVATLRSFSMCVR